MFSQKQSQIADGNTKKLGFEFWEREKESIRKALKIKDPFGYNLFLLKLKTKNTVAK